MDTDTDRQRVKVKVLIIGGITGYLGQLLCIGLSREQGVEIHASSSTSSQSQSPPTRAKTIHLDLLDEASVTAVLSEGSYDVVVNTAAVEFPMTAGVVPNSINQQMSYDAVLGGDVVPGGDAGW